jgi:hypothetical protein
MTTSHSLKADGKPNLFSFDIETEIRNIDRWVFDNKRYSKRDLEKESQLLKRLAKDFIEIIETKILTTEHSTNIKTAIIEGASGVWEPATTKLELLSYYFDQAKDIIIELLNNPDSKIVERALSTISDVFSTEEQIAIFTKTFNHKSKKIRTKTADIALDLRNKNLIAFLNSTLGQQSDTKVREAIQFAIDNMWQPKGQLIL